jgi:hypothetical protein
MTEDPKTYSIALHLRRITYEDAFVAVPVTTAIIKANEEGTGHVDPEAFVKEAIRLGEDNRVEWKVEETKTEAHPVQCPPPEDRSIFDSYYSDSQTFPDEITR